MTFDIRSGVGVGNIKFGMSETEVRQQFEDKPTQIRLTDKSPHSSDFYKKPGIVVHYDRAGRCEAVEFYGPEQPTCNGKKLLDISIAAASKWLEENDPDVQIDLPDITSELLGVALYTPEHQSKTVSVLAFAKGYFDAR